MNSPGAHPTPGINTHRGRAVRAAFLFFLILSLSIGCNFPALLPSSRPVNPPLVSWSGPPTLTPFQPDSATATPFPEPPLADTSLPTVPPTETPVPPPPSPTFDPDAATWPPPNFGGPGPTPSTPVPPPFPLLSGQDTINFLLIGSDRRTTSFRTDTLIIASVRRQDRLVALISIPRDLYVYIPGWTMQRINTAYQQGELTGYPGGGPGLLKDTIRYNLGVRVDHTAMVEFDGFRQIIDTLGGIDVPLACEFTDWHIKNPRRSAEDPDNWKLYTIGPGLVHMDGELALWYARSRLRSSDFDRGRRQQEILRAIYARALRVNVIPHIPELFGELRSAVETDFSLGDLVDLASLAPTLGANRVRSFYINRNYVTSWRTPQNAAVLLPKQDALQGLIQEAMSPPDPDEQANLDAVVEIWDGTENTDWDTLAAERLHYAGFETRLAPADRRDYSASSLYDFTAGQDPEQRELLLRTLGLPGSSLVSSPGSDLSIPYRLVIGEDYNPCFDPASLSR
jgi:polyisoprenyl-teichoic acid--peptidoglycan teichoic acid transferase